MKLTAPKAPKDTRRKILRAAFEEFYKNGFQGGSLNNIVDAAGTTKGALFHHFKGKDDLGYAVVDEIIQPVLKARWLDPLADSIDPIAELKRVLRQFTKEEIENGRLVQGCPLNNLAQEMSPLMKHFANALKRFTWPGASAWRRRSRAASRRAKSEKIFPLATWPPSSWRHKRASSGRPRTRRAKSS
jgi:TetR/AcrR family transcriptional repressor of nem operon